MDNNVKILAVATAAAVTGATALWVFAKKKKGRKNERDPPDKAPESNNKTSDAKEVSLGNLSPLAKNEEFKKPPNSNVEIKESEPNQEERNPETQTKNEIIEKSIIDEEIKSTLKVASHATPDTPANTPIRGQSGKDFDSVEVSQAVQRYADQTKTQESFDEEAEDLVDDVKEQVVETAQESEIVQPAMEMNAKEIEDVVDDVEDQMTEDATRERSPEAEKFAVQEEDLVNNVEKPLESVPTVDAANESDDVSQKSVQDEFVKQTEEVASDVANKVLTDERDDDKDVESDAEVEEEEEEEEEAVSSIASEDVDAGSEYTFVKEQEEEKVEAPVPQTSIEDSESRGREELTGLNISEVPDTFLDNESEEEEEDVQLVQDSSTTPTTEAPPAAVKSPLSGSPTPAGAAAAATLAATAALTDVVRQEEDLRRNFSDHIFVDANGNPNDAETAPFTAHAQEQQQQQQQQLQQQQQDEEVNQTERQNESTTSL